jgi:hypothetical protein
MASKKVNIQIDTRANTTGAKQAETALDAVATSTKRAETASTAAAAASTKQAAGTSRVGTIAQSAGYQVQDFAVQVAGGTSALVAFSQQAPQFLGVFGPGGAIAGALIAVGAIAAKVFIGMADDSASAAEKAQLLAEAVEQIGENAGKAVGKDIDFGLAQIDAAAEQARALIDAFDGITDASNAATLASLANSEKIREAEIEIRRLRGEQVDEIANIAAATEAEAAAREEMARQEIEAQRERLADAQKAEQIAEEAFLSKQSERDEAERSLQAETRKLEILRAQRDELAKQAKERGSLSEGELPFLRTGAATDAQRQLDDPAFQALIAATEARVNALDAQLSANGGKITEAVATAAQGLNEAMANAASVAEAVAIEIPRIEETLQADAIKAEVAGLVETGKQAAEEIKLIAESARPENSGQVAAVEALKGAVSDGVISANETAKVATALQTLNGSINTGLTGVNANVTQLIQLMGELDRRTVAQKRQIDELQARIRSGN